MLKPVPKIDVIERKAEESQETLPLEVAAGEIDPEKLLVDLKTRMALLNKLIDEGGNVQDLAGLKTALTSTITELEEILKDPAIDQLSSKEVA